MGTRCGDIDPAIVYKLIDKEKISHKEIDTLLNKKSGLLALSGLSSDMRDIWKASSKNPRANFALNYLAYKTAKYIGSYAAALEGLDAIVFTGGMGEKAYYLRKLICERLTFLGIKLHTQKNQENQLIVSQTKSKVKVLVIPTDEEKEIAIQTHKILMHQLK
jgi:acetate kinase